MCCATGWPGTGWPLTTPVRACATGRPRNQDGECGRSLKHSLGSCRRAWPAPTAWSWGLRHRVCLSLAGPPRRPAGRPGQLRRAAGHRRRLARSLRAVLPADPRQRGADTAGRCRFRPGDLRIRCQHLVRSLRLDPGGGPGPAARGAADLPGQLRPHRPHLAGPGRPAGHRNLQRPYFGMHRFQWLGGDSVEFHIGHGDLIRLLRRCGFGICDLIEVQPPPGSTSRHPVATLEWARQWLCEEIWKARKSS